VIPDALIWGLPAAIAGAAIAFVLARVVPGRQPSHVVTAPAPGIVADDPMEGAFVRLARALPIGIVVVDVNRRIEFANPSAGAIFGFDLDRVTGVHIIEAVPNIEIERRIGDALSGEASVAPLSLSAQDGGRVFRVSIYPLPAESGTIERVVVLADDQTALIPRDR